MTIVRCVACQSRLKEGPICPRCGCDFTISFQASLRAQQILRRGFRFLAEGDTDAAIRRVRESLAIEKSSLGGVVLKALLSGWTPSPTLENLSEFSSPETMHRMVSEAAYFLASSRGFSSGNPRDDWFEAERQVRGMLQRKKWGSLEDLPEALFDEEEFDL